MRSDIKDILAENEVRLRRYNNVGFFPLSGKGAPLERFEFVCDDMPWKRQYLPVAMKSIPLVKKIAEAGSISDFLKSAPYGDIVGRSEMVKKEFLRLRCKHDFVFFAAFAVKIKSKLGGDVPFVLNYPQIKTFELLDGMRLAGEPIRVIILKARQWGGSTLVQIYDAWIQLFHKEGYYSAIVAHQRKAAYNIRSMYSRMLRYLPPWLIDCPSSTPLELKPFEGSPSDVTITQSGEVVRDNVINIGSMESPDSIRSSDVALVHYSEVAYWKKTDMKEPSDVIRSVSSSILYAPLTVEVMESTANGEGNFFHTEWKAAVAGTSRRRPLFVAWFEIPQYSIPFKSQKERREFAELLVYDKDNKQARSTREEPGSYLWYLWTIGATLEGIHWYVMSRAQFDSHDRMASEFPSDPDDAFAFSGGVVFNRADTARLEATCCPPLTVGDISGPPVGSGHELDDVKFFPTADGQLKIWDYPDTELKCRDRYLVIVDIGGRSATADYSDILVIDRYWLTMGDKPAVVAEWHGHIRHDLLAWKAAQIATYYCNALLVIESNTLETKDNDPEGDHSLYILNQIGNAYPNLYARESPPDNIGGKPQKRWGFHTNTKTKQLVIDNLIRYVEDAAYIERESEAITEMDVYRKNDGVYEASQGYHDDRVMVRAIGLYISECMPMPSVVVPIVSKYKNAPVSEATI